MLGLFASDTSHHHPKFAMSAPPTATAASTADPATVAGWGVTLTAHLRGFWSGAPPAEREAAVRFLKHNRAVSCRCGAQVQAHKSGVQKHSDKCKRTITDTAMWIGAAPKPDSVVAPTEKSDDIIGLLTLVAEAHGVAPETAAKQFIDGGVFMRGLMALHGKLPGRNTLVRRREDQVKALRSAVGPLLRNVLTAKSVCVKVGESSTTAFGGMYVTVIMAYSAAVPAPIVVEIHASDKPLNASRLRELVHEALVQDGRLTEAEFSFHVHCMSSDHAAYNKKAAVDAGWIWCGDAPHAADICVDQAPMTASPRRRRWRSHVCTGCVWAS